MKRLAWLGAAALALSGCQAVDLSTGEAAGSSAAARPRPTPVAEPGTKLATEIAMVIKGDKPVRVGLPANEAFGLFRDPKGAGFESDNLPPKFDWPYRAHSWESSQYGFGEITYEGNLVAAIYQQDRFTQDRVYDIVKANREQISGIEPKLITGKHVNYWFWENGKQRLMICAFDSDKNGIQLTAAMGDDVVLTALGIAPELAERDSVVVDTMLTRQSNTSGSAIHKG